MQFRDENVHKERQNYYTEILVYHLINKSLIVQYVSCQMKVKPMHIPSLTLTFNYILVLTYFSAEGLRPL